MNQRTRACGFSQKVRDKIKERDKNQCLFCRIYGNSGFPATQIMHFVGRAQNGLGVEQNGALGCVKHHQELDNSSHRNAMLEDFESYLMECYGDEWDKEKLVYSKWGTE